MIKSFLHEFGAGKKKQVTPAEPYIMLKKPEPGKVWVNKEKMMHMMRWSRLDIYNTTCYCARHMTVLEETHYNAMICIMYYFVTTSERGLVLKPYGNWDGIYTDYKFEVMVKTDSDYAKCLNTRRIMTGCVRY